MESEASGRPKQTGNEGPCQGQMQLHCTCYRILTRTPYSSATDIFSIDFRIVVWWIPRLSTAQNTTTCGVWRGSCATHSNAEIGVEIDTPNRRQSGATKVFGIATNRPRGRRNGGREMYVPGKGNMGCLKSRKLDSRILTIRALAIKVLLHIDCI